MTPVCIQIRDNEFLQRENLLLESYLAKVDLVKIGISMEEDNAKVRNMNEAVPLLRSACPYRMPAQHLVLWAVERNLV